MTRAVALQELWREVAAQWASSVRLRAGLAGIVVILWIYGLLLAADQAAALRQETTEVREELGRVQPLGRERGWAERADDARQHLAALQSMLWVESNQGLVEARLQDWIRSLAVKTGLGVRDLMVIRGAAPAEAAASTPASGPSAVRARLVVDMNRLALLGFLNEVASAEQIVLVDRLALRLAAQPATVEIDLRILAGIRMGDAP